MNKLKLKETGKEVKMGDKLIESMKLFGIPIPVAQIELNEATLPDLIKQGIIVAEGSDSDIGITIEGAMQHLANRIGWNRNNLDKYFYNLDKISSTSVFEILLKEIALIFDKKYPDHISKSKEIWIINKMNGKIQRIEDLSIIKVFDTFAAFRSYEEALEAKTILAPLGFKEIYGE